MITTLLVALALVAGIASPALGQPAIAGMAGGVPTLAPVLDRVTPAVVNISVISRAPG